jgi:hypothetical protein
VFQTCKKFIWADLGRFFPLLGAIAHPESVCPTLPSCRGHAISKAAAPTLRSVIRLFLLHPNYGNTRCTRLVIPRASDRPLVAAMAEEGVLGELIELGDVMARAPLAGECPPGPATVPLEGARALHAACCVLRGIRTHPAPTRCRRHCTLAANEDDDVDLYAGLCDDADGHTRLLRDRVAEVRRRAVQSRLCRHGAPRMRRHRPSGATRQCAAQPSRPVLLPPAHCCPRTFPFHFRPPPPPTAPGARGCPG